MSASFAHTLDLRQVAPPARHSLIFSRFSDLLPGQALELINDHDPQALNEQLQIRSPGLFSWHYLEQGPQVWRVQIGRNADAANGSCCSGGACCA